VAERHIEAHAGCGDFHNRGDHGLATAERCPHRLAQHRLAAGTAMLHFAVDADDRALAIGDGWCVEQLGELRHEPFTDHRSCFEQGPQIIDELSGERVADHGDADRAHHRPRRCNAEL
jgi:hypothetical protein